MKYYVLDGEIRNRPIREKLFSTRPAAEQAMEQILYKKGLQVEIDRFPSKHTEEFVCDQYTRFSIHRVVIESC